MKLNSPVAEALRKLKKGEHKMTYVIALEKDTCSCDWDYATNEYGEVITENSYDEAYIKMVDGNYNGTVIGV